MLLYIIRSYCQMVFQKHLFNINFNNRAEHSQGSSICFMIKNPLKFPRITFNFQNKLYFQSEQKCRQHALYSHKARYNKPITIPVRMVQII